MGRVWYKIKPAELFSGKRSYPSGLAEAVMGCQTRTRKPADPAREVVPICHWLRNPKNPPDDRCPDPIARSPLQSQTLRGRAEWNRAPDATALSRTCPSRCLPSPLPLSPSRYLPLLRHAAPLGRSARPFFATSHHAREPPLMAKALRPAAPALANSCRIAA
jgi:hypothetical protein